jgi:hypothetical protein
MAKEAIVSVALSKLAEPAPFCVLTMDALVVPTPCQFIRRRLVVHHSFFASSAANFTARLTGP